MTYRVEIWRQWDLQEQERGRNRKFAELNNLYLRCERGDVQMSVAISNELRTLVYQAYDPVADAQIIAWWADEFMTLPGWLDY